MKNYIASAGGDDHHLHKALDSNIVRHRSRNPTKVQVTGKLDLDGVANSDLSAVFKLFVMDGLGGPLLNYVPQH